MQQPHRTSPTSRNRQSPSYLRQRPPTISLPLDGKEKAAAGSAETPAAILFEMSLNNLGRPDGRASFGNANNTSHRWLHFTALVTPVTMFMINAVTPSPGTTSRRTATPSPGHVPPSVHVAQATGGIDWSIVLPTWLGALATVGLLIGAYFTALYAKKAFGEQSKEVQLIQDQLADQREINRRQAAVLDLQASDLRESLEERKRESKRDHKYQAVRVFPFVEPVEGQENQYCVIIKNSSDEPLQRYIGVALSWADGEETLNLPECLDPVMMPQTPIHVCPERGVSPAIDPGGPSRYGPKYTFRDAESVQWTVTSKGEIVERNGPPTFLGALGRTPADLSPAGILEVSPAK